MSKYLYWYYRYFALYVNEYDTLDEAVEALYWDAENGAAAYVGIEHEGKMLAESEWDDIREQYDEERKKKRESAQAREDEARQVRPFTLRIVLPDRVDSAYIDSYATEEEAYAEGESLNVPRERLIVRREAG